MGYFTRDEIPFQFALADAFTICDGYHQAIMAPTSPNRMYLWTGTSSGFITNPDDYTVDFGPDAGTAEVTTYPDQLQQAGISWQVYTNDQVGDSGSFPDFFLGDFGDNPLWFYQQFNTTNSRNGGTGPLATRGAVTPWKTDAGAPALSKTHAACATCRPGSGTLPVRRIASPTHLGRSRRTVSVHRHRPAAGPGCEKRGSEEQFGPGEIGQFFLHGYANRLPWTAHGPLIYGGERPHDCGSELRYPSRRIAGNLEIQHSPAPASGKGLGAVGDDLCALGHLRHGVCGQDRVDPGWEVEAGRVGLHEADIAPAVRLYPILGAGEHRVGQIDADDPAARTDHPLKQREVQTCAACHVDHGVTRTKAERMYGPEALRPLRIAGRGIEPGGDVVVLRLLAVCLDQALLRTAGLAHGVLLGLGSVSVELRHAI
jgi:hypothetical protein